MTADEVILLYHPTRSSENLDCFRDAKNLHFGLTLQVNGNFSFLACSLHRYIDLSNYFLTKDMCIGDVISVTCLH